jgi:hypothetical protein
LQNTPHQFTGCAGELHFILMSKYGGARKGDARVTTRLETISEIA